MLQTPPLTPLTTAAYEALAPAQQSAYLHNLRERVSALRREDVSRAGAALASSVSRANPASRGPMRDVLEVLFDDLLAELTLDICVASHKAARVRSWPVGSVVSSVGDVGVGVGGGGGSGDVFGLAVVKKVPERSFKCESCGQKSGSAKYAAHLEKCTGKGGRASSRHKRGASTAPTVSAAAPPIQPAQPTPTPAPVPAVASTTIPTTMPQQQQQNQQQHQQQQHHHQQQQHPYDLDSGSLPPLPSLPRASWDDDNLAARKPSPAPLSSSSSIPLASSAPFVPPTNGLGYSSLPSVGDGNGVGVATHAPMTINSNLLALMPTNDYHSNGTPASGPSPFIPASSPNGSPYPLDHLSHSSWPPHHQQPDPFVTTNGGSHKRKAAPSTSPSSDDAKSTDKKRRSVLKADDFWVGPLPAVLPTNLSDGGLPYLVSAAECHLGEAPSRDQLEEMLQRMCGVPSAATQKMCSNKAQCALHLEEDRQATRARIWSSAVFVRLKRVAGGTNKAKRANNTSTIIANNGMNIGMPMFGGE